MNSIKVVLVVFGFRQGVDGNRVAARVFREIGSGICFTRIDAETPNLQATPGLPFSPRGEAKCVRGAPGRGASRLARAGVLEQYVEHGKQAQRSPGGRMACFGRRVVRKAG